MSTSERDAGDRLTSLVSTCGIPELRKRNVKDITRATALREHWNAVSDLGQ
jgi:hypothetical protein